MWINWDEKTEMREPEHQAQEHNRNDLLNQPSQAMKREPTKRQPYCVDMPSAIAPGMEIYPY